MIYQRQSGTELILQPYGAFLARRAANRYDVVDRTGAAILLLLECPLTAEQLVGAVQATAPTITGDSILAFATEMVRRGHIRNGQTADSEHLRDGPGPVLFADHADVLKAVRAEIEITNRCNLRCRYCYAEVNRSKCELSFDDWKTTLNGMIKHGLRAVLFSGGEPFLYTRFLDLLGWAAQGLIIEINSNGYYITSEVAKALSPLNLKRVQVSIDSPTSEYHDSIRGRGSHEAAVRAVRLLVDSGIPVQVSTVLTRRNRELLPEMTTFAAALGAEFKADPVTRTGFAREIADDEWIRDFRVTSQDRYSATADYEGGLAFQPLCQSQVGFVAVSHAAMLKPCNMRESFFAPTGDQLLHERADHWWERFYGEFRLGHSAAAARRPGPERVLQLRAASSQYLCELQLAALAQGSDHAQ